MNNKQQQEQTTKLEQIELLSTVNQSALVIDKIKSTMQCHEVSPEKGGAAPHHRSKCKYYRHCSGLAGAGRVAAARLSFFPFFHLYRGVIPVLSVQSVA